MSQDNKSLQNISYSTEKGKQVELAFSAVDETIWITQKELALLFGVKIPTINEHIKNIFNTKELEENSVIRKFLITASDGKDYNTKHYNLDVILSVGYRVNSATATKFRIWATSTLKQYIKDGFVINEAVLRSDPSKLNKLASKIRELRASEKNVFASVRECFKLSSSDYAPKSKEVRVFYALLQDKFHHAITKMTASKLLMDRSDAGAINMGLVSFEELFPTKKEVVVGKNYLTQHELYRMYLLSEQFLLFAESSALMGKELTMYDMHIHLDKLLELNGYPVFDGYKDNIRKQAREHAEREYEVYIEFKKLEMLGIEVDIIDFYTGAYSHYLEETSKITMKQLRKHFREKELKKLSAPLSESQKLNNRLKEAINHMITSD